MVKNTELDLPKTFECVVEIEGQNFYEGGRCAKQIGRSLVKLDPQKLQIEYRRGLLGKDVFNVYLSSEAGPPTVIVVVEGGPLRRTRWVRIRGCRTSAGEDEAKWESFLLFPVRPGALLIDVDTIYLQPLSEAPETLKSYLDELIRRVYAMKNFLFEITKRCQVHGRLMRQQAEELFFELRPGPFYSLDSDDLRRELAWDIAKQTIEERIINKELSGFLDGSGYIDKALKEQTVRQISVSIDFNALFEALGKKGIVLQRLTCPACGGQLPIPKSGSAVQCEYCGASIQATNVFEQFKGILGL